MLIEVAAPIRRTVKAFFWTWHKCWNTNALFSPFFIQSPESTPNRSNIISLVHRLSTEEDLIADGSRQHSLPTVKGKHRDLKSVSPKTVCINIISVCPAQPCWLPFVHAHSYCVSFRCRLHERIFSGFSPEISAHQPVMFWNMHPGYFMGMALFVITGSHAPSVIYDR